LACVVAGCSDDRSAAARAAFERFQSALFAKDKAATRRMLTRESRAVVDHLPWDRLDERSPLDCLVVEESNGQFNVRVTDPNQDDRESIYVVVSEDSRLRVDLIRTTAFSHRNVALPGPATRLVPRELSQVEIEEIAAREASLFR
jgi:hypothetical protein